MHHQLVRVLKWFLLKEVASTFGLLHRQPWRGRISLLRLRVWLLALLCAVTANCHNSQSAKPETKQTPEDVVTLSADEVARLGIQTAALQAIDYAPNVQGYGLVVSFDALAQADSEVATASAAARQSQAEFWRQEQLSRAGFATREALDLARKQAATDAAQLTLAERKEAATFGGGAPWLMPQRHNVIFAALSTGRTKLVHASFPIGSLEGAPPSMLTISRLDNAPTGIRWRSTATWLAPADPTIPGRSVYALVEGSNLTDGERVLVTAPVAAPIHGVLIPVDAIIVSEGQAWCYLELRSGRYERRLVDMTRSMPGGYFTDKGFSPGTRVVVQGQSLLLAHEQAPASETAED